MQFDRSILAAALLAGACHKAAAPADPPDAFIVSDAETSPGCDFVERDGSNPDDLETIPFDYTGQTLTVCGQVDPPRDDDEYLTHSSGRVDTLARVELDTPVTWWDGKLSDSGLFVSFGRGQEVLVDPQHAILLGEVASDPSTGGNDALMLSTFAPFPDTVHYKVTMGAFDLGTLCPAVTTPVEYTEADDGADSTGNDVFDGGTLTASTTDAAEPTGLTIDAGSAHRIAGVSANPKIAADGISDRDTFAITTGAATHFLFVRSTPQGSDNAFLFFELAKTDLSAPQYSGNSRDGQYLAGGIGVFAVEPSTTYWLQVAGVPDNVSSGNTGLPINYDVSICGQTASP